MSDTKTDRWDKRLALLGTDRAEARRNAMHFVAEARGQDIEAKDSSDRARFVFESAVNVAHRCGASYRDIAEAAGVSPMTIQRIVTRER